MRFPKIYVMYSSQSISRTLTKQYQMKFLRAHLVTPTWSALYLITYAIDHFRVPLIISFKASLSAKLLL